MPYLNDLREWNEMNASTVINRALQMLSLLEREQRAGNQFAIIDQEGKGSLLRWE